MGNTCSINTLIQCLGHSPIIREYILNNITIFKKKENYCYSIGEELHIIFKQLWIDKNSLMPIRFLKALQETLGDTCKIGNDQMDFTEVWIILLQNLLQESHQIHYPLKFYERYTSSEHMLNILNNKAIQEWKKHSKDSHSPLLDILQGTLIQQIECKTCHHLYHNLEPFQCTHLELNKENKNLTLENCITKLLESDSVSGWKCDKCKNESNEKVIRFWNLPNLWILILNRFYGMSKLHTPLTIPQEFTLSKGFEMKTSNHSTYKLKGIANHYGSLYGGHYNAICCNEGQDDWYNYDDISIRKINNIEEILHENPHAYALFYERSNNS